MVWFRIFMATMPRVVTVVTLPIAAFLGYVGYCVEGFISTRHTPGTASISQQRAERLLQDLDRSEDKKKKHNPLEVNLSPSLAS